MFRRINNFILNYVLVLSILLLLQLSTSGASIQCKNIFSIDIDPSVFREEKIFTLDIDPQSPILQNHKTDQPNYSIKGSVEAGFVLIPKSPQLAVQYSHFYDKETSPYAIYGGPLMFALKKSVYTHQKEPYIHQSIWDYFNIFITKETKSIYVPPLKTINESIVKLEKMTGLQMFRFIQSSKNYLEDFVNGKLPFNEPIHDFFIHFTALFEPYNSFNFLRKVSSDHLRFFNKYTASDIQITEANYQNIKNQMTLFLTVTIDNATGLNLTGNRTEYMNADYLLRSIKKTQSNLFAENFLRKYFSIELDNNFIQNTSSNTVLALLAMHALTYGATYTNKPVIPMERLDLKNSINVDLNTYQLSSDYEKFASAFSNYLNAIEPLPQPHFVNKKTIKANLDEIKKVLTNSN